MAEPRNKSENNVGFASATLTLTPTHAFIHSSPSSSASSTLSPFSFTCFSLQDGIEFLFVKQLFLNLPLPLPLFHSSLPPPKLVVFSDFLSISFFPPPPKEKFHHREFNSDDVGGDDDGAESERRNSEIERKNVATTDNFHASKRRRRKRRLLGCDCLRNEGSWAQISFEGRP